MPGIIFESGPIVADIMTLHKIYKVAIEKKLEILWLILNLDLWDSCQFLSGTSL